MLIGLILDSRLQMSFHAFFTFYDALLSLYLVAEHLSLCLQSILFFLQSEECSDHVVNATFARLAHVVDDLLGNAETLAKFCCLFRNILDIGDQLLRLLL